VIHFQLVAASGVKFDDDAYEILLPTEGGTIAVFEDHMPLISAGAAGVLSVRVKQSDPDSALRDFAVAGGVMQVDGKSIRFVADEITTSEEVSEKEAEEALKRAEALMGQATTQTEIHEAKRMLQHSSAKLHVARLKSRHHK
jgi:ATP synthase F1 epsilon subunit